MQMDLRLNLPERMAIEARLRTSMHCEHYRTTMQRSQCIRRQTEAAEKWSGTDNHCRSGRCYQGRAVLLEERILKRAKCPTCHGCGWIPAEVDAPATASRPSGHGRGRKQRAARGVPGPARHRRRCPT